MGDVMIFKIYIQIHLELIFFSYGLHKFWLVGNNNLSKKLTHQQKYKT